ncbi:hypothetical protein AUJ84_03885 [Candidatus Pacearchaeota archaeon CG1_02_32_132]|nr:MAG: hypothetical protein AUJ84_03885 [Candidatus Pacearchaeota archaeon CG1_02_32_132]
MNKEYLADLSLRIGLGFVFVYVAFSAFMDPNSWVGFIPSFLRVIGEGLAINLHIAFNLILGLWLFSGKGKYYSAIVSVVALFLIVTFNLGAIDIIFRDIGLILSAIALALLNKKG